MSSKNSIWFVAKSEYIRYVMNPKMIIVVVMCLIIRKIVVEPVLFISETTGQLINLLEIPIAVANSWLGMVIIILTHIILMSSFPSVEDNMPFYVSRTGRAKWITGELLFQVMSALTHTGIVLVFTLVSGAKRAFLVNGWSLLVTDFDSYRGGIEGVSMDAYVPPNLYFQITPYKAFAMSYILLFLFIMFCNLLFVAGCLYSKRIIFFFIQTSHIVAAFAVMQAGVKWQWMFPLCHALLSMHYQEYFRKYIFSPARSVVLLLSACIIFAVIIYRKAETVSLDMIGGDVLS